MHEKDPPPPQQNRSIRTKLVYTFSASSNLSDNLILQILFYF